VATSPATFPFFLFLSAQINTITTMIIVETINGIADILQRTVLNRVSFRSIKLNVLATVVAMRKTITEAKRKNCTLLKAFWILRNGNKLPITAIIVLETCRKAEATVS
jgi:hypothetical protein